MRSHLLALDARRLTGRSAQVVGCRPMRDPETRRIKADLLLEIHASDELGCLKAKLDRYQRALNDVSMAIKMEPPYGSRRTARNS